MVALNFNPATQALADKTFQDGYAALVTPSATKRQIVTNIGVISQSFLDTLVAVYHGTAAPSDDYNSMQFLAPKRGPFNRTTTHWFGAPPSGSNLGGPSGFPMTLAVNEGLYAKVLHSCFDSGQSTSTGSTTTLNDTTKNWIVNQWASHSLLALTGANAGVARSISSNTATQLTTAAFASANDKDTLYAIVPTTAQTATAGAASSLTDSGRAWYIDYWAGLYVVITSGTGNGQTRRIASNTATALTVASNWGTNPDSTSVYSITAPATLRAHFMTEQ